MFFFHQVDKICKHDINVFINRQLIYNYPEQLFADKGVMAIEHADFDGIERLALVTGEIFKTLENGFCKIKLLVMFSARWTLLTRVKRLAFQYRFEPSSCLRSVLATAYLHLGKCRTLKCIAAY